MQVPDGDEIAYIPNPDQTEIPAAEPEPGPFELVQFLNATFPNMGTAAGGQLRGVHFWVEYMGGEVIIWNALNMRYVHKKTKDIPAVIQWIRENKDTPQPIPKKWQV